MTIFTSLSSEATDDLKCHTTSVGITFNIRVVALWFTALVAGSSFLVTIVAQVTGLAAIPAYYLLPFLPGAIVGGVRFVTTYSPARVSFLGLLGILLAGLLWTASSELFDGVLLLITAAVTMFVSVLFNTRQSWISAASLYCFATFVSTFVLLVDFVLNSRARLGTFFYGDVRIIEPNQVGTAVAVAVIAQMAVIWNYPDEKRKWLLLRLGTIVWFLAVILFTGSRGSLLTIAMAIVVFLFFGGWNLGRILLGTGVLAGLAGFAAYWFLNGVPEILNRFTTDNISSAGGRTDIWSAAWRVSNQWGPLRAIVGEGTGAAPHAIGREAPELAIALGTAFYSGYDGGIPRINGHSSYVEWWLTFGGLGLVVAALLILHAITRAYKVDVGRSGAAALAFVAIFLMTSVSLVAYRMVGVSIACGAISLGYIFMNVQSSVQEEEAGSTRTWTNETEERRVDQ